MSITLYSVAANAPHAAPMALLHAALIESMEHHGETPQYLAGVAIRVFRHAPCVECDHCGAWVAVDSGESPEGVCKECRAILPEGVPELRPVEIPVYDFVGHLDKGQAFTYERHTVRDNGVSQICLTLSPEAY